MSDEALRLLERIGSVRVRGEWHVRCLNGGFYDQQTRPCACDALRSFLVQPTPAAREAVLVGALEIAGVAHQMYKHQTLVTTAGVINQDKCGICKKLAAALADTSPAAEALLAQGERIKTARGKVMMIDASPAGSLNAQLKAEALAALAPGEEKE